MNNTNTIEITDIKEKQVLLIEIMNQVHSICEKYGLIYNLFGGTMLGAVRHKGIIPWDDDIDITMPREDYKRFLDILKREYSDMLVVHAFPDKGYIYPFAKIGLKGTYLSEKIVRNKYNNLTLNIDVFPNDGYPDDENILNKYSMYEKAIIRHSYKASSKTKYKIKAALIRIKWDFLNLIDRHDIYYYLQEQIAMISKKSVDESEYIICQGAGWGKKGKLKKEIYYNRKLYDFNGKRFWGISDYDEHLTALYGDYMALPPEDKRKSPHTYDLRVEKEVFIKYLGGNGK